MFRIFLMQLNEKLQALTIHRHIPQPIPCCLVRSEKGHNSGKNIPKFQKNYTHWHIIENINRVVAVEHCQRGARLHEHCRAAQNTGWSAWSILLRLQKKMKINYIHGIYAIIFDIKIASQDRVWDYSIPMTTRTASKKKDWDFFINI